MDRILNQSLLILSIIKCYTPAAVKVRTDTRDTNGTMK